MTSLELATARMRAELPPPPKQAASDVLIAEAKKQTEHLAYIREVAKAVKIVILIWFLTIVVGLVSSTSQFWSNHDTRGPAEREWDRSHSK